MTKVEYKWKQVSRNEECGKGWKVWVNVGEVEHTSERVRKSSEQSGGAEGLWKSAEWGGNAEELQRSAELSVP